jgi:hypothetical protein
MPEVSQYPPGTCCWLELTTLRPRNEAHQPWVSTNLSRLIRMVREDECGRFRLVHLAPASCNVSIAPWAVHLASRRVSRLDFVRFLESGGPDLKAPMERTRLIVLLDRKFLFF